MNAINKPATGHPLLVQHKPIDSKAFEANTEPRKQVREASSLHVLKEAAGMERSCRQWREQLVVLALAVLLFAFAFVQCTGADGEVDGPADPAPGKTGPPLPPGWTGDSGSGQGSSPDGSWKYGWGWAAGPGGKGAGFGFGYGGSGGAGGGGGGGDGGGSGSGRPFGFGNGGYGGHPGDFGGGGGGSGGYGGYPGGFGGGSGDTAGYGSYGGNSAGGYTGEAGGGGDGDSGGYGGAFGGGDGDAGWSKRGRFRGVMPQHKDGGGKN